jgi:hypothetical protein
MTQYDDEVRKHKLKMEAEDWGRGIKYLYASDGLLTIAYNNGSFRYEETKKGGKVWTEHTDELKKQSLLDRFSRWIADREAGYDHGE